MAESPPFITPSGGAEAAPNPQPAPQQDAVDDTRGIQPAGLPEAQGGLSLHQVTPAAQDPRVSKATASIILIPSIEKDETAPVSSQITSVAQYGLNFLKSTCQFLGISELATTFKDLRGQVKLYDGVVGIVYGDTLKTLFDSNTPTGEKKTLGAFIGFLSVMKATLEAFDMAPEDLGNSIGGAVLAKKGNDLASSTVALVTINEKNRNKVLLRFAGDSTGFVAEVAGKYDQKEIAALATAFSSVMKLIDKGITWQATQVQMEFQSLKQKTDRIMNQEFAAAINHFEKDLRREDDIGFVANEVHTSLVDLRERYEELKDAKNEFEVLAITKFFQEELGKLYPLSEAATSQLEKVETVAAEATLKINEARLLLMADGGEESLRHLKKTDPPFEGGTPPIRTIDPVKRQEWINQAMALSSKKKE